MSNPDRRDYLWDTSAPPPPPIEHPYGLGPDRTGEPMKPQRGMETIEEVIAYINRPVLNALGEVIEPVASEIGN